jgi:hypothetical protein
LPAQIDSMTVIRNSGMPRLRTTQTFSNYRRYVTGGTAARTVVNAPPRSQDGCCHVA